jgi:hypothetical protein
MRTIIIVLISVFSIAACETAKNSSAPSYEYAVADTMIVQSLFSDKASTISEDNIRNILEGNFKLPQSIRVAIVKLESPASKRNYYSYWSDEEFLKTQQSYLDLFSEKFRQSPRVVKVSIIPDLLISKTPTYTNLREAAVRMQADVVVVYAITSDIYSKYKLFSKSDIKAFATTQLIILDVRTGLVPFSSIVTKDFLSQKRKEELDHSETRKRVQNEAVLLTIDEIGQQIIKFLQSP